MPSVRVWLRNGLVGALLVSWKALLQLVATPLDHSALRIAGTFAGAGVLAGLAFTALTPFRNSSKAGLYVTWIISVYVVLAAIFLPWWLAGDEVALNIVRMPIGWLFFLGSGAVTGIFLARQADRWSRGDFR